MIPDHIKTYPMDELQESAYQRFADILRMYAGPILEEAIRSNLEQAHILFTDAVPRLAERLIALGLRATPRYRPSPKRSSSFSRAWLIVSTELNANRSTPEQIDGDPTKLLTSSPQRC